MLRRSHESGRDDNLSTRYRPRWNTYIFGSTQSGSPVELQTRENEVSAAPYIRRISINRFWRRGGTTGRKICSAGEYSAYLTQFRSNGDIRYQINLTHTRVVDIVSVIISRNAIRFVIMPIARGMRLSTLSYKFFRVHVNAPYPVRIKRGCFKFYQWH